MFYAYVIKSQIIDRYYYGHTQNLIKRLEQHNKGETKSIKAFTPFKIVYFEKFESGELAIEREKYFKSTTGRRFIKRKLLQ